jgi:peptidoglycan/LPS O-acetylase OafA/YrhL
MRISFFDLRPLEDFTSGRDNNFNLIRFWAASMVMLTHSCALSWGAGRLEPLFQTIGMTLGDMAVDIFFLRAVFWLQAVF